jgi:hypothetical protein
MQLGTSVLDAVGYVSLMQMGTSAWCSCGRQIDAVGDVSLMKLGTSA